MQEKLQKIKAKCQELLELGKERTQGAWWDIETRDREQIIRTGNPTHTGTDICEVYSHDAEFIASCVGPAEAGWRSTIAAIEGWTVILNNAENEARGFKEDLRGLARANLFVIAAAWPDELLK